MPSRLELSYCVKRTSEEFEFQASKEGLSHHVINDHELKDVLKNYGLVWINANIRNISRNLNYAQDHYHLQKWERFISCN